TWKSAFGVLSDNPLFGVGPEVLKMVFPRYETDLFRFKEAFHVKQDRCHNETFDVPVTKGLITLAIYLWLLFTLFKTGLDRLQGADKGLRLLIAGLLAAATAYLIQNQFSFGVVAITSLFWIIWGMVMRAGAEDKEKDKEKIIWEETPWLYVTLVGLATLALIYVSFLSFRADVSFKSGKNLMEMRRLPEAVKELNDSLAVLPFEGTTISHLGITYLNAGDIPNAINMLRYGNAVDAYNADNFHMLARVYISLYDRGEKDKLAEAQKNAETALKIDPYYAEAYQSMGMIYERAGQRQAAAKMYQRTFMVNPNLVDAMRDLERVSSPAETMLAFEEAYKKYSDNPVVLEQIGNLYLGRGQVDQAAKVAGRMTDLAPDNPAGFTLTGQVELQQGAVDRAFQSFQEVIRLDPKNIGGHLGLGTVYLRQGNRGRAKEEFDQVLVFDPNNEYAKRLSAGLK
ncbi:MAG TPA: tetratricopeptide repeat protein, partial [Candidatus Sulfotelmatobacter sp.]|nr:tetratricopeptide repeat protein [Candidatus Sulfotelmatobacter sp.]